MLRSEVPGFEGPCLPVWVNRNRVCHMQDGGVTGFFRRARVVLGFIPIRTGPEFHGIIRGGNVVETTRQREKEQRK